VELDALRREQKKVADGAEGYDRLIDAGFLTWGPAISPLLSLRLVPFENRGPYRSNRGQYPIVGVSSDSTNNRVLASEAASDLALTGCDYPAKYHAAATAIAITATTIPPIFMVESNAASSLSVTE
jgi:hypothetical protein